VLFPNWVDISAISPLIGASQFRDELGLAPDDVVVLYSGNMGAKQGLDLLPQVAAMLVGRPDIQFVFCGNGAGRPDLVDGCAGLANVRFLDLQPNDRLNDLLGLADIHLLPQRAGAADLVMPSKLTGMLASGRAILATARPETQLSYVLEGCGLVVPPESAEMVAEGVRRLADDAALRERLGKAARAYAEEHLDKEKVLSRFLEKLQIVCSGGK
jgi:colanic acid biosynthesis glycosyl transferase WcaI